MTEEKALELLKSMLAAYREKQPTVMIALICAATFLGTLKIVGKAALLLSVPILLIVLIREID